MDLSVYQTGVLITTGINILLGLGVFVMLSTGQLSLGTAGFMAIGAYTASVLTVGSKWDLNAALVAGGVLASLVGTIVAFPALRLRGIYLALATLAFGQLVRVFFLNSNFTGAAVGYKGMSGTTLALVCIWVVAFLVAFWRLYESRLGRAFRAVAQDEIVGAAMGLNITLIKVAAFAIAGFAGGVAGGLYAHDAMYITPDRFTVAVSLYVVLIVVLGGKETFWGVVLGAVIFAVLPEALRFLGDWRMAAYGAIFVGALVFRPSGLLRQDSFRFLRDRGQTTNPAQATAEESGLQRFP